MTLRVIMAALVLAVSGCAVPTSEKGWISPANALETKLVEAARSQSDVNYTAFSAELRNSKEVFVFIARRPHSDAEPIATWMPPIAGKQEIAIYTSRPRLEKSPHAAGGPVEWAGLNGGDVLQDAANCGYGVVVNYGLLPQIEISPDEVVSVVREGGGSPVRPGNCRVLPN